jgi:hypothetical protein
MHIPEEVSPVISIYEAQKGYVTLEQWQKGNLVPIVQGEENTFQTQIFASMGVYFPSQASPCCPAADFSNAYSRCKPTKIMQPLVSLGR